MQWPANARLWHVDCTWLLSIRHRTKEQRWNTNIELSKTCRYVKYTDYVQKMQKIRVQQPRHAKTLKPNPYWRLPGSAARQAIQSFQSVELLDARAVMRRETFQRALQTAPKAKAAALQVGRIDWESIEESKFHLRSAVHVGKNFWSNTRFGMFGHRFAKQALGWLGNAISKRLSNQFMNQNLDWHCV